MLKKGILFSATALGLSLVGAAALGASRPAAPAKTIAPRPGSAAVAPMGRELRLPGYNVERNAYFGDLHVHTYLSNDAYISNVRRTPDDAYRFARGQTLTHASGFQIRLEGGPLDFVAVTDHSEYLSAIREAADPDSPLGKLDFVKRLFTTNPAEMQKAFSAFVEGSHSGTLPKGFEDPGIVSRGWREVQDAAARNYVPGRFTTLVGYEYTSVPDGRNNHRNVFFRSARTPTAPFAATQSANPEDLWRAMDGWRSRGIDSLAIPHNANGSDGLMFDSVRMNGKPLDRAYADLRARNEPLAEITQIKGTSETHPTLSPNDEWANFEIMERYIGRDKPVTRFHGGYVRRALEDGLVFRDKLGVNPFKLGFIGSSDNHNASPGAVEEQNYFGASGGRDGKPTVRDGVPAGGAKTWEGGGAGLIRQVRGASGLAGVWAEQNTREAIFSALKRRETFATSGPRIRVRFFAGYDFPRDLASRRDAVPYAYAHGTPMGGDLLPAGRSQPGFLVMAVRDPGSAHLQRAQIVKGWVENGQARERIFDVACSDGLKVDSATGRCPDNKAGVDLQTCQPDRFKGDVELRANWSDPTFKPGQRAFYYVRVVENPTCRWSTWDALRNGTPPNPKLPTLINERAWSSPIWYEPRA